MEKIIDKSDYPDSDYDRLKTLYSVSKKLSTYKNVDESFAEIVSIATESFPLLSAVLIEHWEKKPRTAVWFSAEASKSTVARALLNAKTSYSYLSGASEVQMTDFLQDFSFENELSRNDKTRSSNETNGGNYILLPLIIDDLPPLGALQLEGATLLTEKDLEFVSALANLVSVALDRFYKTKKERALSREKIKANLEAISQSKNKVEALEVERALREDFVSLLTHDLKSPLSVILGASELICKRKDDAVSCLKLGDMIVQQSKHLVKMINNLLDANQIRSGQKSAIKLESIRLDSLVIDIISEFKLVHGDRFIVVSDRPIYMTCDKTGIKRILENLCNNAIKYGSPSTPVKIFLEETSSDILIKVHNFGQVISLEDQKTIFNKFQRTSEALHGLREGWGIGLTLVRGVAQAHGGRVEVESTVEAGTFFIVTFPKDLSGLHGHTP